MALDIAAGIGKGILMNRKRIFIVERDSDFLVCQHDGRYSVKDAWRWAAYRELAHVEDLGAARTVARKHGAVRPRVICPQA